MVLAYNGCFKKLTNKMAIPYCVQNFRIKHVFYRIFLELS